MMKPAACILLFVWTFLLLEPGFANYAQKAQNGACAKKYRTTGMSCSRSACSKPVIAVPVCSKSGCENPGKVEDSTKETGCTENPCNPLMSCPTGNFYLSGLQQTIIAPLAMVKEKKTALDDKRLSDQLSECWHPPEMN